MGTYYNYATRLVELFFAIWPILIPIVLLSIPKYLILSLLTHLNLNNPSIGPHRTHIDICISQTGPYKPP